MSHNLKLKALDEFKLKDSKQPKMKTKSSFWTKKATFSI